MNSEKILLTYLREILKYDTTAYMSYSALKRNVSDEKILGILEEIANDEEKHVRILNELIAETEGRIKDD